MRSFDLNGKWIIVLDFFILPEHITGSPKGVPGTLSFKNAWAIDGGWSNVGPWLEFDSLSSANEYICRYRSELVPAVFD